MSSEVTLLVKTIECPNRAIFLKHGKAAAALTAEAQLAAIDQE